MVSPTLSLSFEASGSSLQIQEKQNAGCFEERQLLLRAVNTALGLRGFSLDHSKEGFSTRLFTMWTPQASPNLRY